LHETAVHKGALSFGETPAGKKKMPKRWQK